MTRPSVVVLLSVSAVPTLAGLVVAFGYGLNGAGLARVLDAPGVGRSILLSVWTGVAATGLSLVVAHLALAVAVTGGWRRRLRGLSLPLLAMPHLAIGIGLALVLAPSGLLLRLLSPWATGFTQPPDWFTVQDPLGLSLIAGLAVKESAFLVLVLFAALQQVPAERLLLQARSLGYGRLKGWLLGVAPLLQAQIRLPLAAVLVFGLTNVEMAIPLGPGLPPTFSVMLWRWFVDPDPAIHAQAWTGSLVLLGVTAVTLLITARFARLFAFLGRRWGESGARFAREAGFRRTAVSLIAAVFLLGLLALVAIVLRSAAELWRFPAVLPPEVDLSGWSSVLAPVAATADTTVLLAAATALIGVCLVLPAAERLRLDPVSRRRLGVALFLPLLLPQITLLFGLQVMLTWLRADGTLAAVLWSHLLFALPYLWGVLAPARAAFDPRYLDVARTLGAGPARAWMTVTGPFMLRATFLAMALAFSVSVALYLPTLFAGAGRIATSATEAAAAAASGALRPAAAQSILLALLPLCAFGLAYAAGAALFRHRRGMPR